MTQKRFIFRFSKALQATSYLLRMSGGHTKLLKLLKLLYIADRTCLKERKDTITGDRVNALENGPVLSTIYSLIKGNDSRSFEWRDYIVRGEDHNVFLINDAGTGELYEYEKTILEKTFEEYGKCSVNELIQITHEFPEWKKYKNALESQGTKKSYNISVEDLAEGVGLSSEAVKYLKRSLTEERFFQKNFGATR